MCIFLNNVRVPIIATTWFWGVLGSYIGSPEGSAGDWLEMGQNGPKHYKSGRFFAIFGVRNDPRVPIRGVRAPILSQHPDIYIYIYS